MCSVSYHVYLRGLKYSTGILHVLTLVQMLLCVPVVLTLQLLTDVLMLLAHHASGVKSLWDRVQRVQCLCSKPVEDA